MEEYLGLKRCFSSFGSKVKANGLIQESMFSGDFLNSFTNFKRNSEAQKECHQSKPDLQLKNEEAPSFSFKNNEPEQISSFSDLNEDEISYLTTICKAINVEGLF